MTDATEPPRGTVPGRACRNCGYALGGLPTRGLCPECGTLYPPVAGDDGAPMTAWQMCWRLGWPVAGFAGFLGLIGLSALGRDAVVAAMLGLFGSGVMLLATIVNTPVQIGLLARRHAPPGRVAGSFIAHLNRAGRVWVSLVMALTLSPLVFFGACLYVITR